MRDDLLLLHGVRIALIHELYLNATRVPEFSAQTGATHEKVLSDLLALNVPPALDVLGRVFPSSLPGEISDDFGETATYRSDDIQNYRQEHQAIFRPISKLYHCIRRVSSGVVHFIGAVG